MSQTRHLRPGIPAGLPLDQAREKAASLLADYRAAMVRAGAAVPVKTSQWSGYALLEHRPVLGKRTDQLPTRVPFHDDAQWLLTPASH